jgi:hypothetical protein
MAILKGVNKAILLGHVGKDSEIRSTKLDQQEKEFESWGLSEPAVPRRSECFHLQPMGFGTGYVECLTSYFSRLAVAHCVSAGALTHRIMIPRNAGKRNMFSWAVSCRVRRLRCPTSGINSIGSMAARLFDQHDYQRRRIQMAEGAHRAHQC